MHHMFICLHLEKKTIRTGFLNLDGKKEKKLY